MNLEILKKIKSEFGVDVEYYDQGGDEQGYVYEGEYNPRHTELKGEVLWEYQNGHSEWDVEGKLKYSTHGFKIHEDYL
jgi:hypothetical protein